MSQLQRMAKSSHSNSELRMTENTAKKYAKKVELILRVAIKHGRRVSVFFQKNCF